MKDIYINGRFLADNLEGVQRFGIGVTKELAKIMNVTLICPNDAKQIIDGVKYITLPCRKSLKYEMLAMAKFIKKNKITNVLNVANIGCIRYPYSCVIHDTIPLDYPKACTFKYRNLMRVINRLNMYRYKQIYTVSNYSKNKILHYYPKVKKDIIVLGSAADQWDDVKEKVVNLPFEGKYYFALSVIREYKNFKYLLDLAKVNPTKKFVATGSRDKIAELGEIPDNVYFTGYLSDEEVKYLYKNCEAFIFPSLDEGFGLPPLEAIRCGCKKIILSNIEPLREIYFTGCNFIDVSKTYDLDKLELIEITKEDKDKLFAKFNWQTLAKQIEQSWEE